MKGPLSGGLCIRAGDRVIWQEGGGDRRQRLKEMVSNSYSGGFGREPAGDESVHRRDFGVSGTHLPRPA